MAGSGDSGGFDQSYNAQAVVDAATMLVVATHLTQAPNDKQQIVPALQGLALLPQALGTPANLLADTGYFSAANVAACEAAHIEPMIAIGRQGHHPPVFERFAPDTAPPATDDPVDRMAHRLTTRAGRTLDGLRKQTTAIANFAPAGPKHHGSAPAMAWPAIREVSQLNSLPAGVPVAPWSA